MRPTHTVTHTETPKMCNFEVPYNTSTSPAFAHEYSSILYYMHIYFRVRQNKKNRRWRKSGKKNAQTLRLSFYLFVFVLFVQCYYSGRFLAEAKWSSREVQKIRKDSEAQAEFLGPLWTINRTVFST